MTEELNSICHSIQVLEQKVKFLEDLVKVLGAKLEYEVAYPVTYLVTDVYQADTKANNTNQEEF